MSVDVCPENSKIWFCEAKSNIRATCPPAVRRASLLVRQRGTDRDLRARVRETDSARERGGERERKRDLP